MKRLALILAGVAVAGAAAATPAVAGLAGNPSFSHEIPVPAPSAAKTPSFADDHSPAAATRPVDDRSGTAWHTEPGDDHGTSPAIEPGDDRGRTGARAAEPGDDRGGATRHAEPGDDHGGAIERAEPGDDRGGVPARAGEPGDDHGGVTSRAEPGDDSGGQVLRLVAAGLANKQIARRLGIAESTVKVHAGNIFRRIGVTDRTSAALWAKEHL